HLAFNRCRIDLFRRNKLGGSPTVPFGLESGLLFRLESGRLGGNPGEKGMVVPQPERLLLNRQLEFAIQEIFPVTKQLFRRNWIELNLVEKTKQPGLIGLEILGDVKTLPNLNRAANELIAPRSFHAVDA